MRLVPSHLCVVAALLLSGCGAEPHKDNTTQADCTNHLHALMGVLWRSIETVDTYPRTLADLAAWTTNGWLFVCPATHHKPADLKQVEDWSDYIYVGGLSSGLSVGGKKMPLVICPPENHGGEYGYVMSLYENIERVPAQLIRQMVAEPWVRLPDPTGDLQREYDRAALRKQAIVFVPKRLRPFYPNAYAAQKPSE